MKSFKQIEKDRIFYHKYKNSKTVHRSSLLAPIFRNSHLIITFLNHFYLKRNYKKVACKVTTITTEGNMNETITIDIDQPKVYEIETHKMFDLKNISNVMLEFYSNENLFIPFPAVIINHRNNNFNNMVHSYNRILNDIFENDSVNKIKVSESSIDVINNKKYKTFINFTSGIYDFKGNLKFELDTKNNSYLKNYKVKLPRLSNKKIYLNDVFKKFEGDKDATLKISQPQQSLFFGRLFAGIENSKGEFSSNHSFYDNSKFKEYHDSSFSIRTYPFFKNTLNAISMYPIMSKSKLDIEIQLKNSKNKIFVHSQKLISPSKNSIFININEILKKSKLGEISSFSVIARTKNNKVPTRINHQLIYGDIKNNSLNSSINVSLTNNNDFVPKNKNSFKWGQFLLDNKYDTRLGFCFSKQLNIKEKIKIKFYDNFGLIGEINRTIGDSYSINLTDKDLRKKINNRSRYLWFTAESKRYDLSAFTFHKNKKSKISSGEHSF